MGIMGGPIELGCYKWYQSNLEMLTNIVFSAPSEEKNLEKFSRVRMNKGKVAERTRVSLWG